MLFIIHKLFPGEKPGAERFYRKFMNSEHFFLQAVSPKIAEEIYNRYMVTDFPPAERKPLAMILQGMLKGNYEFLGLYAADQTLAGYAVLVTERGQSAALLDYYAVLPQNRCGGVGSAGLALLRQYYAGRLDNILIESEYPAEAPDPALAERRLGFYARAGCRKTSIAERLFGVRYTIFSLDCSASGAKRTSQQLEEDLRRIYAGMIPEPAFSLRVQFGENAAVFQAPQAWDSETSSR